MIRQHVRLARKQCSARGRAGVRDQCSHLLTQHEYDEWGDARMPLVQDFLDSFCPSKNVTYQKYPSIFISAAIHDNLVDYESSLKWIRNVRSHHRPAVSSMSHTSPAQSIFVFDSMAECGHGGPTQLDVQSKQFAKEIAFLEHAIS